ncbi:MAG: helix-turn-helix domain-containing protein [Thermaerobacter sp.]|nr:helix-turn-helix domain-containing protein [Thermaerobacter sp.]
MGALRAPCVTLALPRCPLALSTEDVEQLRPLVFGQKVERRIWLRASIVWHLARGMPPQGVGELLGVHLRTVRKWQGRFAERGVAGLHDLHASWVNQVENFFSILHRRCLRHGDFRSEEDLRDRLLAFIARWNKTDGHPFRWTFRGYPVQEVAV